MGTGKAGEGWWEVGKSLEVAVEGMAGTVWRLRSAETLGVLPELSLCPPTWFLSRHQDEDSLFFRGWGRLRKLSSPGWLGTRY